MYFVQTRVQTLIMILDCLGILVVYALRLIILIETVKSLNANDSFWHFRMLTKWVSFTIFEHLWLPLCILFFIPNFQADLLLWLFFWKPIINYSEKLAEDWVRKVGKYAKDKLDYLKEGSVKIRRNIYLKLE